MKNNKNITIFAQGMRRSGTTIFFDLMMEDGKFNCFYEPLAKGKQAFGGGSGVRKDQDLFLNLREARETFLSKNPKWLERCPEFRELGFFNYGAPRLAELEFEPDLPLLHREYIEFLTSLSNRTFLKFTRMHSKAHCLKEIIPESKFIHIVRDPRHVTASYLFGKDARNKHRFENVTHFFSRVSSASAWSSRPFSEFILQLSEYSSIGECEDFLRILLIWKYKFERTHYLAKACFGEDYLLLRHDDLLVNPKETLAVLGNFIGESFSSQTIEWAINNLRPPSSVYAHEDKRWQQAFNRLGMINSLTEAGYGQLVD